MKYFVSLFVVLFTTAAVANTKIFDCSVGTTNVVKVSISLADDQSVDFVIINVAERAGQSMFFAQLEKGEVAEQLSNGYLQMLAMTEQTGEQDGVIVNTGFLALGAQANGTFDGFLAAKGNIYPMTCKK